MALPAPSSATRTGATDARSSSSAGAQGASTAAFLSVPGLHVANDDEDGDGDGTDEHRGEDEEDDDRTIGVRTPRLSAQRTPYSAYHNNLSQATIIPLPPAHEEQQQSLQSQPQPQPQPLRNEHHQQQQQQHTYTSLGSHISIEQGATPELAPSTPAPSAPGPPHEPLIARAAAPFRRLHAACASRFTRSNTARDGPQSSSRLSAAALFTLTLALAGAQLTWTLELAYGNLFLLSLGLSKPHSALVWLAGPLSGLIAQPLIGALSDRIPPQSPWRRYRRRLFLVLSAVVLTLSTALLAFVQPCARFVVDAVLHVGEGDWDPDRLEAVDATTKFLAILAFWILDLALNGLQAAARALILEVAPRQQQSQANAWHGRMTHAGNVLGYAAGWADLGSTLPFLHWLGGGQFRKLAILSLVGMLLCVAVTCISTREPLPPSAGAGESVAGPPAALWAGRPPLHQQARPDIERPPAPRGPSSPRTRSRRRRAADGGEEHARQPGDRSSQQQQRRRGKGRRRRGRRASKSSTSSLVQIVSHIARTVRTLPRPLARVCLVQLFAFSAWFPFLFFSTTYVVELERIAFPDQGSDRDTERGSFAMMLYAIVALGAGSALPYLAIAARRQQQQQEERDRRKVAGASHANGDSGPAVPGVSLPPPSIETAGGTDIYQRDDADTDSSALARDVAEEEEEEEEEEEPVEYTSFSDRRLRFDSALDDDDDDADDDDGGANETSALLGGPGRRATWADRLRAARLLPLGDGLTLRTLWTLGSLGTFLVLTLGTLALPLLAPQPEDQVSGAMMLVALMGVPWAVASWVPFALLGEFIKEAEESGKVVDDTEGGGGGCGDGDGGDRGASVADNGPGGASSAAAGARAGVRAALLDCEPLPTSSGKKAVSTGASCEGPARRGSSPRRGRNGRRPAALRRLPSDLPGLSSDEDEDDVLAAGRGNGQSSGSNGGSDGGGGDGGLRVLPGSEAYTRRLEQEEIRRAAAMRRRRALEEEAENRRELASDEDADEYDETDGDDDDDDDRDDYDDDEDRDEGRRRGGDGKTAATSAGTILGIHNLAIVLPQFFVALVATLIFRLSSGKDGSGTGGGGGGDDDDNSVQGVVWVLRFGGAMALLAGLATRVVPLTRTEREAEAEAKKRVEALAKARARAEARARAGVGSRRRSSSAHHSHPHHPQQRRRSSAANSGAARTE